MIGAILHLDEPVPPVKLPGLFCSGMYLNSHSADDFGNLNCLFYCMREEELFPALCPARRDQRQADPEEPSAPDTAGAPPRLENPPEGFSNSTWPAARE